MSAVLRSRLGTERFLGLQGVAHREQRRRRNPENSKASLRQSAYAVCGDRCFTLKEALSDINDKEEMS